jgi:hypothetical protein
MIEKSNHSQRRKEHEKAKVVENNHFTPLPTTSTNIMEEDHLQLGNLPIRCWALDVCTKVRFELCIGVMEATIW